MAAGHTVSDTLSTIRQKMGSMAGSIQVKMHEIYKKFQGTETEDEAAAVMAKRSVSDTINVIREKMGKMVSGMYPAPSHEQVKMQKQVDEIHKKLQDMQDKEEKAAKSKEEKEKAAAFQGKVEKIASATTSLVNVMQAIKTGGTGDIVSASLSAISSFAVLAGPEGAVVSAIIGVVSAFFAFLMTAPPGDSLPAQIQKIIQTAFENFNVQQVTQDVDAWSSVAASITLELKEQQKSSSYKGFTSAEASRFDPFIALLGKLEGLIQATAKDDESANRCVTCISAYVKLAIHYIMVLSWHLALCHDFHHDTKLVQTKLDEIMRRGKDVLEFLSDKSLLGPAGMIDDRKLLKMKAYRPNLDVFETVENFRTEVLGLPETKYSIDDSKKAESETPKKWPVKWDPRTDEILKHQDEHHFVLVNHTRWPIRVFSGTAGNDIEKLSFTVTVEHGEVYAHKCGGEFSAGGIFCVGETLSEKLEDMKDAELIEFAMSYSDSYPFYSGYMHIHTVLKNRIEDTPGKQAWDELSSQDDPCKSFRYKDQLCLVQGAVETEDETPGTPYPCIWVFCVQETTIDELKQLHI